MTLRSGKASVVLALALAVAGLSACAEKPQTTSKRKADVEPWMGVTPTHKADGWAGGDQTSWDNQLRKRAQGQNEYTRTSP
jgi:endonuclease I